MVENTSVDHVYSQIRLSPFEHGYRLNTASGPFDNGVMQLYKQVTMQEWSFV